jgi:hypothetical protein
MFKLRAMTMNQAIETRIFTNATDLIAVSRSGVERPLKD